MAKALMVQGTCSGAGKSLLVAGLCRIFADRGVRVAPFKSQNMALNSFVTESGAEIGRAQALQAEAARLTPTADMNPILLKASGSKGCQVIVAGRVHDTMSARAYYAFRDEAWRAVTEAYERLCREHDLILIEGAGSPAEINLAREEIVNMRMARHARSPVLLVGDIDRGGVFASFMGTVALLDGDAGRIRGFVVNKFRGDGEILRPGLDLIREKTGIPVVGVVPHVTDVGLDEEDGLSFSGHIPRGDGESLRVVVVRLPYISNFTDFEPFRHEPDVELLFTRNRTDLLNADLLIVPGSKNTVKDLLWLRETGLAESIKRAAARRAMVVGICGGYQMLGRTIRDPLGVESEVGEARGVGLLDVETEIQPEKVTAQCEGHSNLFGSACAVRGYEIHMGKSTGEVGLFTLRRLSDGRSFPDGSQKGSAWGTYLHGIFDGDQFRAAMLDVLRREKGLPPREPVAFREVRERNMQRWARRLEESLDMDFIGGLL
ncbi:MAG: cobyric acid synthase [Nitrospirota bacterium]|jgi:adenosylcobyric acid synthase